MKVKISLTDDSVISVDFDNAEGIRNFCSKWDEAMQGKHEWLTIVSALTSGKTQHLSIRLELIKYVNILTGD